MNNFKFWHNWLKIVSAAIILLGLFFILFPNTSMFTIIDNQVNPVFWGTPEISSQVKLFQNSIYGITGAIMAGWGLLLFCIVWIPVSKKEFWALYAILFSLLLWYIPDTIISYHYTLYFNVIGNSILLILYIIPLLFIKNYFKPVSNE